MPVTLKIDGLDELASGLRKLDGHLDRALGLIAKGVGFELKNQLQMYPPQRPNTDYQRTRKLSRGWHVEAKRTSAIVGNPVPYAPFVQSQEQQAWMHEGWWDGHTDVDKVQEVEKSGDVERIAKKVIRRILRFTGLA